MTFGAPNASLTLNLNDPHDGPTNPFQHRFHPDHDNLNADFEPIPDPNNGSQPGPEGEGLNVTRVIQMLFAASDPGLGGLVNPENNLAPDWGSDLVGGTYSEQIRGLHRTPIRIQGTFRLRRVSDSILLNPDPGGGTP